MAAHTYIAGGNISPSRFIALNRGTEGEVVQADGTVPIRGISQEGTRRAPGTGDDDGFAAIDGEYLRTYTDDDDETCLLETGDAVSAGDLLVSDGNGRGVPWSSTLTAGSQYVGAEAKEGCLVSAVFIRVRPYFDIVPDAAS